MAKRGERRLPDGRTVAVGQNNGLRKLCGCARPKWSKCGHPWHFSFAWRGKQCRLSLDRHTGRHIDSKTEAESVADRIREEIRSGTFGVVEAAGVSAQVLPPPEMTFEEFGRAFLDGYSKERGKASWNDDASIISRVMSFRLSDRLSLGEKAIGTVSEGDAEALFRSLKAAGRAVSTLNHYVQVLKAMSAWAVKKGYRSTPFVASRSDVVRRGKHAQRSRRLQPGEEADLLDTAGPHLHDVIVAALETGFRLEELLSLQWADVAFGRNEVAVRAENTKTRRRRAVPMSERLRMVLEARCIDPSGARHRASAYVFGNPVGDRIGSVKRAWQTVVLKAHGHKPEWVKGKGRLSVASRTAYHLIDLHFHDLRHEAGSRLLEAGWPLHHVKEMLGHTNVQQTSTYLNATLHGLHDSMRRMEAARRACEDVAKNLPTEPRPVRNEQPMPTGKLLFH